MTVGAVGSSPAASSDYAQTLKAMIAARASANGPVDGDGDNDGDRSDKGVKGA